MTIRIFEMGNNREDFKTHDSNIMLEHRIQQNLVKPSKKNFMKCT